MATMRNGKKFSGAYGGKKDFKSPGDKKVDPATKKKVMSAAKDYAMFGKGKPAKKGTLDRAKKKAKYGAYEAKTQKKDALSMGKKKMSGESAPSLASKLKGKWKMPNVNKK